MAELAIADVVAYTGGRLVDDGPTGETQRLLDAALAAARAYVGWHVSPVETGAVVTVDGPGRGRLFLNTMRIVSVDSIVEDGETVDPEHYIASASVPGMIYRRVGCWTRKYAGITVTYDHGYTEAEAADWRQAILAMVDAMSLAPVEAATGHSPADLITKKVDDVQYGWSPALQQMAAEQVHSMSAVLDRFRILPI